MGYRKCLVAHSQLADELLLAVAMKGIFMESRIYTLDDIINFGKYKGKSVHKVLHTDPSYLVWANKEIEWFNLSEGVLDEALSGASEQKRQYYIDNLDYIDYYDFCGGDDY